MNPTITVERTGEVRTVTNLGWLLRHRNEVTSLTVDTFPDGTAVLLVSLVVKDAANLDGIGTRMSYRIHYQSARVLWDVLHRPAWADIYVLWNGVYERLTTRKGLPVPTTTAIVSLDYVLKHWPVREVRT